MRCFEKKCTGLDWIHLHGVAEKCYSHWSNSHTFTSCFPSNGVVNYWCKHHVSLPPTVPLPTSLLRGSPSSTESPTNTQHTIYATRSKKADRAGGKGGRCTSDVAINCFLLIQELCHFCFCFFLLSFSLWSSLQYLKQHAHFCRKKPQLQPNWVGLWAQMDKKHVVLLQTKLSAVMLLVLKFKQRCSTCTGVSCLFVLYFAIWFLCRVFNSVYKGKKQHRCVWIPKVSECMFYHSASKWRGEGWGRGQNVKWQNPNKINQRLSITWRNAF